METYDGNSEIVKKLNELNLLNGGDLVVSKFENKNFGKDYLDVDKKIEITCKYDSLSIAKIELSILNKTTKIIDFQGGHIIGVLLRDIDNDNIKEVLIVTNYYIMNGDNFLLTILKYK